MYNSSVYGLVHSVEEGTEVLLSCPSPAPWLLCVWLAPSGERRCQVRLEQERGVTSEEVCGPQAESHHSQLTSSSSQCDLRLSSKASHHGLWTCMMTLDRAGQYESLVTRLVLAVTSPPSLSVSHNSTHLTYSADHGYPAPSLQWSLEPGNIPLLSDQVKSVVRAAGYLIT